LSGLGFASQPCFDPGIWAGRERYDRRGEPLPALAALAADWPRQSKIAASQSYVDGTTLEKSLRELVNIRTS
jgi:hypothetical protein